MSPAQLLIQTPNEWAQVTPKGRKLASPLDSSIDNFGIPQPRNEHSVGIGYQCPGTALRELIQPTLHRGNLGLMRHGALAQFTMHKRRRRKVRCENLLFRHRDDGDLLFEFVVAVFATRHPWTQVMQTSSCDQRSAHLKGIEDNA
ncbi:hypothetical protein D9M72_521230 [compost metagenome]